MWFYIYICIQWSLSSLSDKVWSIGKGVFFGLWVFPCLGGTKVTWTCLFRLLPGSSALFCFLCLIFCNSWVLNTAAVVILKSAIPVPHFLLYWGIIDTQLMPPTPQRGEKQNQETYVCLMYITWRVSTTSFLLRITSGILMLLPFHIIVACFWAYVSTKILASILIGTVLNLDVHLGRMAIFSVLSLPSSEHSASSLLGSVPSTCCCFRHLSVTRFSIFTPTWFFSSYKW